VRGREPGALGAVRRQVRVELLYAEPDEVIFGAGSLPDVVIPIAIALTAVVLWSPRCRS
jgi:hypothetical protein